MRRAQYRVRDAARWAQLQAALAVVRVSLGPDSAEDVELLVFARACREGILTRDEVSGVWALPLGEAAE